MREPYFWNVTDLRARGSAPALRILATPLAMLWAWETARKIRSIAPADPGLPVICVGNLTLGGAGKTPVSAVVRSRLSLMHKRAATLSRGYRGSITEPIRIDPGTHTASEAGDEPLMLAASGESWVSKDRIAGAAAMKTAGVDVVVMDDGHQNPTLKKTLSLVVIDAGLPFGNGFVCPKGPLREPVKDGLARADAVILMDEGPVPDDLKGWNKPILRANLTPVAELPKGRYVAFAGIGRPMRFFDSLKTQTGVELCDGVPFADHHAYVRSDLDHLMRLAADHKAKLVTTDKDFVRLPVDIREHVMRASVVAEFEDVAALDALLAKAVSAS